MTDANDFTTSSATPSGDPAFDALYGGWVAAIDRRDRDAIVANFAEDGVYMPDGAPEVRGHDALGRVWDDLLAGPGMAVVYRPHITITEAGDLAYDHGAYSIRFDGPDGPVRAEGKYVVIWKRVGDRWRVALDIDNLDRRA